MERHKVLWTVAGLTVFGLFVLLLIYAIGRRD